MFNLSQAQGDGLEVRVQLLNGQFAESNNLDLEYKLIPRRLFIANATYTGVDVSGNSVYQARLKATFESKKQIAGSSVFNREIGTISLVVNSSNVIVDCHGVGTTQPSILCQSLGGLWNSVSGKCEELSGTPCTASSPIQNPGEINLSGGTIASIILGNASHSEIFKSGSNIFQCKNNSWRFLFTTNNDGGTGGGSNAGD